MSALRLGFFTNIESTNLYLLPLHINFRISLLISIKLFAGILIWIALNLYIKWGQPDMLMILSLPTHKHRIFLHLFCSSLVSLMTVFSFYSYKSCTYFVRIILKHFVWGSVNVNGSTFLILNSTCSLLVYRKVFDFCTFTLHLLLCYNYLLLPGDF